MTILGFRVCVHYSVGDGVRSAKDEVIINDAYAVCIFDKFMVRVCAYRCRCRDSQQIDDGRVGPASWTINGACGGIDSQFFSRPTKLTAVAPCGCDRQKKRSKNGTFIFRLGHSDVMALLVL